MLLNVLLIKKKVYDFIKIVKLNLLLTTYLDSLVRFSKLFGKECLWLKEEKSKEVEVEQVEQVGVEHSYSRKRTRKQASKKIKITIQFIKRRSIVLIVEPDMEIESVMKIITARVKIPVDAIRLIFAGQQLRADYTLDYYHVEDRDTLTLVERLAGC